MKEEKGHLDPHLALRLGKRRYACDLDNVQEIVNCPELEPSLFGAELCVGMYGSSRGVLPVLDLLCRPPDVCPIKTMSLMIFESSGEVISLLVDELLEIVEFDPDSVLPLPKGANGVADQILRGVIEVNENDYYLLDIDQIVTAWLGTVP